MVLILCALLISPFLSHAQLSADSTLLEPFAEQSKINEIVVFTPVEGHKINLKSKNSCGAGRLIEATEKLVQCQMTTVGVSNLELYVCDKKNTYCKREKIPVTTESPGGIGGWVSYYWNRFSKSNTWRASYRTEVSHNNVARGFIHNDLKAGITKAKAENKRLLVYFTQIYCPPCRMMKEMSLESDIFQEIAKDVVKVQLDTDIDVSPELVKPLKHKYTPTMMLFNSDFQEIDRMVGIMSPQNFKTWFAHLEKLNWPVASDLAKKINLTDLEKIYMSQWYFSRYEDDKMMSYADGLNGPWAKLVQLKNTADTQWKINGLKKINLKTFACRSKEEKAVFSEISNIFDAAVEKKSEKFYNSGISFMKNFDAAISNKSTDALGCAFAKHNIYLYSKYYSKKMNKLMRIKEFNGKLIANLNTYPKLAGVKKTTQISVEKLNAQEDEVGKKKLYVKMRKENRSDYTYDYWEASDALGKKDYELALKKVDQSLSIAKDRSWQKALSLKVKILKEMNKGDEALTLIKQTLDGLELPYSEYPKVHIFVQSLRKKQKDLEKI